jgi:hypothetical protein
MFRLLLYAAALAGPPIACAQVLQLGELNSSARRPAFMSITPPMSSST